MARTANVFIRVEPEIKEQAEAILTQLGIPMSNAVGIFLRQVILQRGLPFEMKLPESRPLVLGELTKTQIDAALEAGLKDLENGSVKSADAVEAELHKRYGV